MIRALGEKVPRVNEDSFIAENAMVVGDVKLGRGVSVWYGSVLRGDTGPITIGEMSNIQDLTLIHVSMGGHTDIGSNVSIGHKCTIHGCTIMDDTLVGMDSIVLDRAVIGRFCIIGAGSLVTKGTVIPDKEVWVGRPARFLRKCEDKDIEYILHAAEHYREFSAMHKGDEK
ncbi:gamma carbonic anhydrase family protein [Youngiibacter multivorans]|uniref:Carbonic anhydrase/acetyltransferase-like protein (Isoleucine patch superfamily) n=1 Tax=Youngiibacter multivorans TaxID=937251 RepID=A0ABS4G711_9CLOT|nr:gamma carbonic anhydrase family protein [Youngiibacter multivorans]MBP1920329.1 carbonic anhydrase/acetyltransferase-like protein (isoleucine patch superfamily) [Youngiibacter multivorans]